MHATSVTPKAQGAAAESTACRGALTSGSMSSASGADEVWGDTGQSSSDPRAQTCAQQLLGRRLGGWDATTVTVDPGHWPVCPGAPRGSVTVNKVQGSILPAFLATTPPVLTVDGRAVLRPSATWPPPEPRRACHDFLNLLFHLPLTPYLQRRPRPEKGKPPLTSGFAHLLSL